MVKRVGKYELGRTLGQGTFGKVKLATHMDTGQQVAIKVLDKEKIQKQNMGAQIKKEISIMKMVKQTHVVKLYEVLARYVVPAALRSPCILLTQRMHSAALRSLSFLSLSRVANCLTKLFVRADLMRRQHASTFASLSAA